MTQNTDAVVRLAARRWRIALALTAAMVVVYFGFLLLIAFARPVMATPLRGGLTLGIVLGVLVIASAWGLTFTYVRWTNQHYDVELARIRATGDGQ